MVDNPTRGNNPSCIDKLVVEESIALSDQRSIKVLLRCPGVRITSQSRKSLFALKSQLCGNKQIKNIDWTRVQ